MMDAMYSIPSDESIVECVITKESVDGKADPIFVHGIREVPEDGPKKERRRKLRKNESA